MKGEVLEFKSRPPKELFDKFSRALDEMGFGARKVKIAAMRLTFGMIKHHFETEVMSYVKYGGTTPTMDGAFIDPREIERQHVREKAWQEVIDFIDEETAKFGKEE